MRIHNCVSVLLIGLMLLPVALRADDFKIMKLEQDVRNLERQVSDLYRQVDALQRQAGPALPLTGLRYQSVPQPENTLWLDVGNWDRIRVGMNELDVIRLLGKPASLRGDAASASRTLLYATEIGSSGFLGGSVELKDRQVAAIHRPALK